MQWKTYIASTYMKQKFPFVLSRALGIDRPDLPDSPDIKISHPRHWSIKFSLEFDLDVIADAFHNQGFGYFSSLE